MTGLKEGKKKISTNSTKKKKKYCKYICKIIGKKKEYMKKVLNNK